jgi:hypothetical protein
LISKYEAEYNIESIHHINNRGSFVGNQDAQELKKWARVARRKQQ